MHIAIPLSSQVWELSVWFLKQVVGHMHDKEVAAVAAIMETWVANGDILFNAKLEAVPRLFADLVAMVKELHAALPKRAER